MNLREIVALTTGEPMALEQLDRTVGKNENIFDMHIVGTGMGDVDEWGKTSHYRIMSDCVTEIV